MEDGLSRELRDCRTRSLNATGTAVVLEDRADRRRRQLTLLAFVGVAVPVVVGGLVLSYGAGFDALSLVIAVGAVLSLVQLVISVWALAVGWADDQGRALRSAIRNRELAASFDRLANELWSGDAVVSNEYVRLTARDDAQQEHDYALGFTQAETRAAHRAGLRQNQVACIACNVVPVDMSYSNCGVCGDFIRKKWRGFVDDRRSHSNRADLASGGARQVVAGAE